MLPAYSFGPSTLSQRKFLLISLKRGALLRPIGNTVYFMPPYVIEEDEFSWLVEQTIAVINEVCTQ